MKKVYLLLIFLGIYGASFAQLSPYCNTEVFHLGDTTQTASSIFLTIEQDTGNTMKITMESANADPIDDIIIPGFATGFDTISPGKYSKTLSFISPPANVSLQVLWSKVSFPGNWQLSPTNISIPFTANCAGTPPPSAQTSKYCNTTVLDFSDTTATQVSAINLSVGNIGPNEMKVVISSANADPVDDLIIAGGSGATISPIDNSVPGEMSRILTWTSPPVAAEMNIIWSKVSTAGNWQLIAGSNSDTLPFIDTCSSVTPPPSVNITFMVNTANITVDPTGLFLAGGASFGVPGTNPMTDTNNDGIWEITVNRPVGFSGFYIFTNGSSGWGAKENLAGLPCGDPNNFNDRTLPPIMADTTLLFCYETCATDTVCSTTPPPSKAQINMPITWNDTANVNYSVTDFGGTSSMLAADPMNANNMVLQTIKDPNGQTWQGTTLGMTALANPIAFGQGSNTIRAHVYSPTSGIVVKLKVEDTSAPVNFLEVDVLTTSANAWEVLDFDFNNPTVASAGATAGDPNISYTIASIFYDFNNPNSNTYYLDSIQVINGGTPPPPPAKAQIDLPISWDDTANVNYTVTDFGGTSSMLAADPMNANNMVLQTIKDPNGQTWQGTTLGMTALANPIAFGQGSNTIRAHVYSPTSGIVVKLKVEDTSVPVNFLEVDVLTTSANAWEVLDFDFNNPTVASAGATAGDPNISYTIASIFYDFNNPNSNTYYLDSIQVINGGTPPVVKNVTFKVDLSDYSGPAYTSVNLNGTFNNWCGACAAMTDANNDTIYEITIPLADDSVEYKFTLDGWNVDEQLTAGAPCTKTVGGFTNRFLKLTGDTVLPEVCWQSCGVCTSTPVGPSTKNITFQVDMNDYTGTFTTVHVNGTFNNWCGACNPMTDANNDGVWEVTLPLAIDSIEYKFTVDGWTDDEKFAGGEPCTKTVGGFTNRFLIATGDVTLPVVCWASCSACTGAPSGTNITFKVDMNDYTSPFDTAYVNGTFNNWCGKCNPMTDANNDGVWELTINLPQDSIEFKYTVDGWDDDEKFLGGESCTKTVGGFTNRILRLNGDTVLPELCWGSCAACTGTPTIAQVRFAVDLSQYPDTFTTAYVNGEFNGWCGKCNPLSDADGDSIWEVTITLPIGDTVQFKYTLNGWQTEEILDPNYPCVLNVFNFTNRILAIEGDTNLGDLCWESCWECEPVGLTEGNQPNYFVVAPNPSNGNFVLDFSIPKADNIEVQLLNITGQTINAWRYNSNQVYQQINIDGSSNGIYFLKVQTPDYVGMKKIIISK